MTALEDEPEDKTLEAMQSKTVSASASKEDVALPVAEVVTNEEINTVTVPSPKLP